MFPATARRLLAALLLPCAAALAADPPGAQARRHMIAVANPLAAAAGLQALRDGGSALDAALVAQLVLNLVEPQSSGIGGGAFLLHWDAAARRVAAYDGRETAPAAARPDRFLAPDGRPMPFRDAMRSGLSVGVPGLLRLMELAHARHGRLPWPRLFAPAIHLAETGFAVSPRLHAQLAADDPRAMNAAARAYFFDAAGRPWPVGHRLRNPAFAAALRRIAREGPAAFYGGAIARDIVAAVRSPEEAHGRPGDLSAEDLARYRALEREPLCAPYRAHRVCGVPPPSSGGLAVLGILGLLERFPMTEVAPGSARAIHLFAEAGRLAYADRDRYVGDPAFVPVPVAGLLDRAYLGTRAALIREDRSQGRAAPGAPPGAPRAAGADSTLEAAGTSHLSAVDARGNAVAMTSSIEARFGSGILVHGFLLNNQLTDFAFDPGEAGRPAANRAAGGKRPRSSMAPTLVFDAGGALRMALGSPGGSAIINYVARTLVATLDWGQGLQEAIAAPNMGSRNRGTELERGTALEHAAGALRALGHPVEAAALESGLHGIAIGPAGLAGGADPRREGVALGD